MKCLILAAGYATRLYPLTENFPKPLLKVGEKTILDWLIDDIHSSGVIDEFAVVTNHKFAGIFEDWTESRMNEKRRGQRGPAGPEGSGFPRAPVCRTEV